MVKGYLPEKRAIRPYSGPLVPPANVAFHLGLATVALYILYIARIVEMPYFMLVLKHLWAAKKLFFFSLSYLNGLSRS